MILFKTKIQFFIFVIFFFGMVNVWYPKNIIHEKEIFEYVRDYITMSIRKITETYEKKYNSPMIINQEYLSQQSAFVDFLSKEITKRLKKYHSRDKIIQSIRDSFEFNFNCFIFPDSLLHKTNVNYYRELINFVTGKNHFHNERDYKLFLEGLL